MPYQYIPNNPLHRQMQQQALPFSLGNPAMDMMAMMALGSNLGPRPQPGTTQGLYDAMYLRQRTLMQRQIQMSAIAHSMPAQRFGGVNESSPAFQMLGSMLGDPNGATANFIAPLIGGNPMKAQMGMFGNLNTQAMSTFGRMGSITMPETSRMMDTMNRFVYHQKPITNATLDAERADLLGGAKSRGLGDRIGGLFTPGTGRMDTYKLAKLQGDYNQASDLSGQLAGVTSPARIKAIEDAFKNVFKDTGTQDALAKAFKKGGSGDAIKKEVDTILKVKDMNHMLNQASNFAGLQGNLGKTLPSGINYGNTMGIHMDDFSSAFTTAASHKLLGKSSSFEKFMAPGNKPGAMLDSLKGLFGNDKGGKELITSLSALMGNSFADLSTKKGTKSVEEMARNLKALSRTADISVEALIAIIKDANTMTERTAGLAMMGGAQNSKLVVKGTEKANATSMFASNEYVRRHGGMAGLISEQVENNQQSLNQPIARQLGALYHLAERTGGANGERATKLLEAYRSGSAKLGYDATGFGQLASQLAQPLGLTKTNLLQYSRNEQAQNLGMSEHGDKLAQVGENAVVERGMQMMNQYGKMMHLGPNYGEKMLKDAAFRKNKNGEIDLDAFGTDGPLGASPQISKFIQDNRTAFNNRIATQNPAYNKALKEEKGRRTTEMAFDKHLTETMGQFNAPGGATLVNELFTTSANKATLSGLLSPLMMGDSEAGLEHLMTNSNNIHYSNSLVDLNQRVSFKGANGQDTVDHDKTVGLMQDYQHAGDRFGGLTTLAEKSKMSQGDVLKHLAGMKDVDGKSALQQKKEWQASIHAEGGWRVDQFIGRNHTADRAGLDAIGAGNIADYSKLDQWKGALVSDKINQFRAGAQAPNMREIDKLLQNQLGKTTGAAELFEAAGGMSGNSRALNIAGILDQNYDAKNDPSGQLKKAREKFNTSMEEQDGSLKRKDKETDADHDARIRNSKTAKNLQQKTAHAVEQAGIVAGVGKTAAADATVDLAKGMKTLIDNIPALLKNLQEIAGGLQEAVKPN